MRGHRSIYATAIVSVVLVGAIVYFFGGRFRSSTGVGETDPNGSSAARLQGSGDGVTEESIILSFSGWRLAAQIPNDDNDGVRARFRDAKAGKDAARLAATRPHLVYDAVDTRKGREHSLTGTIEPTDLEGIRGLIAMSDIRLQGHLSAPPRSHLNQLGYMVRVLMPILSPDGSVQPLSGTEAFVDRVREGLASAGMVVPENSRVVQLITASRSTDLDSNLHFGLRREPRDFELAAQLRERSGLTLEPIEGAVLTGGISMAYQNAAQEDREISIRFVFDKQTESWILYGITLMTSSKTQIAFWKKHGRMMSDSDQGHAINFLSVLPDCVIVADERLLVCIDD